MPNLFKEQNLRVYLLEQLEKINASISSLHIGGFEGNSENLTEKYVRGYTIENLEIDFENPEVEVIMMNIRAPWPDKGEIPTAHVNYTFKITNGSSRLLWLSPEKRQPSWNINFKSTESAFTLQIPTKYGNVNLSEEVERDVKSRIRAIVNDLKSTIEQLNAQIEEYNTKLPQSIKEFLIAQQRKSEFEKKQRDSLKKF